MRSETSTDWSLPIRFIKGVGDRLSLILARKNIRNIEDALYFFPRTYEDRRQLFSVKQAKVCSQASVIGRIRRAYPVSYTRSRRSQFEVLLEDLEENFYFIRLKWFHRPFNYKNFKEGNLLIATGNIQVFRGQLQMPHPEIEFLGKTLDEASFQPSILPVYSQTDGLYQKTIRKIERRVVENYAPKIEDHLPKSIRERNQLLELSEALRALHLPKPEEDFKALVKGQSPAHQRLIYDEFFLFSLVLGLQRKMFTEKPGIAFQKPEKTWAVLKENLAFSFTGGQRRVLKEILDDMCCPRAMFRMVQGDVGSGKTVVAAAAALIALESGYQVAVMAPTEVLIEQHFEKFRAWYKGLAFDCLKLTASLKTSEKREVLESLKDASPKIVFGTHALFEEKVQFSNLGFVIVDEQHRFGVRQRARLVAKGKRPDVLVMTATPIPRSLALTIYGDLDVSVIDELPPGRRPIETRVFSEREREKMYARVEEELHKGRQVYMVFPLIEESEKLDIQSIESALPQLQERFASWSLTHLHGKLSAEEKNEILSRFQRGEFQILVSTTVIEVGVDVPNASLMIIENAERFGLSQLHQLRGRVGRGALDSYCFLVSSLLHIPEIRKRLQTMEKTSDGFRLSEIDLELRGPGEFLGTRQSGMPEFQLARLPRDILWLQKARRDALEILREDPELSKYPKLKAHLKRKFESFELS